MRVNGPGVPFVLRSRTYTVYSSTNSVVKGGDVSVTPCFESASKEESRPKLTAQHQTHDFERYASSSVLQHLSEMACTC